jgi:branched-subunit amino acid transport protein
MDQTGIFLIILGMTLVTYLPRLLPMMFLSSSSLPSIVISWLRYIPIAVLAAMLAPSLLFHNQRLSLGRDNPFFWGAFPTFLVAWKTRSLFGAVITGMIFVGLVRVLGWA